MELKNKKCVPCEGNVPPLDEDAIRQYLGQLKTPWEVLHEKKLVRKFKFNGFEEVMAFANAVAEIAGSENHHPSMHLYYDNISIELWTHAIKGLSENDFIMASKIEALYY